MIRVFKLRKALRKITEFGLKLEESIHKTIYEYEGDLIVFFDYDGDERYKGTTVFSKKEEKIGDVHWYYLDKSLKEFYVFGNDIK